MTGKEIHICKCPTEMSCGLALSPQPPSAGASLLWSQNFQPPGRDQATGRVTGNLRAQAEACTGASCAASSLGLYCGSNPCSFLGFPFSMVVFGGVLCVCGGCLLCSHRKIHPSRWSLLSPEDTEGFMRWEGALLAPLAQ